MDTTETYIGMCRQAKEIQQEWIPQAGDFYVSGNNVWVIAENEESDDYILLKRDKLFLPRQDQLQGMLKWTERGTYGVMLLDAFYEWSKRVFKPKPFGDDSMTWEQHWLRFVMHYNHHKVWNGEDWVKE